MRWFVLSHNPIVSMKNSRCINVHIINDGHRVFAFHDLVNARYMRRKYCPDSHIVPINDPRILLEYCEQNSLLKGVKVINTIFCDLETKKELPEYEDVNIFEALGIERFE